MNLDNIRSWILSNQISRLPQCVLTEPSSTVTVSNGHRFIPRVSNASLDRGERCVDLYKGSSVNWTRCDFEKDVDVRVVIQHKNVVQERWGSFETADSRRNLSRREVEVTRRCCSRDSRIQIINLPTSSFVSVFPIGDLAFSTSELRS